MMVEERQRLILEYLRNDPNVTVRELAKKLYVSEPTIRRDFTELHQKGLITKFYGGAVINSGAADREIPFLLRENEKSSGKVEMGRKAADLVRDGMVIMMDGSTSAYHIVPYLTKHKDLIVITSGAKTAVALADAEIKTFSTGGQMLIHSYSYVGEQAESFVKNINADILFFSTAGVSEDGRMSDRAIEEANLRKVMFGSCKRKVLLCDNSKFGKSCFYNMGNVGDIDDIISDGPLPPSIAKIMNEKKNQTF